MVTISFCGKEQRNSYWLLTVFIISILNFPPFIFIICGSRILLGAGFLFLLNGRNGNMRMKENTRKDNILEI